MSEFQPWQLSEARGRNSAWRCGWPRYRDVTDQFAPSEHEPAATLRTIEEDSRFPRRDRRESCCPRREDSRCAGEMEAQPRRSKPETPSGSDRHYDDSSSMETLETPLRRVRNCLHHHGPSSAGSCRRNTRNEDNGPSHSLPHNRGMIEKSRQVQQRPAGIWQEVA